MSINSLTTTYNTLREAKNEYLYNGKMYQDELGLNWYDYGTRFYDPALARFHTIDILADTFSFQTPYAYAINNPIRFIDWMGMGPGDLFKTKDEAANDWGKTYNGQSINNCTEYGSTIGSSTDANGNTVYSYDVPAGGANATTSVSPAPAGTAPEADIHSHGCYEVGYDNNNFSPEDKQDNDNKGIDGYVSTPDGSLKKYEVSTQTVTVVNTDIPSDPNDPNRQNTNAP